MATTLRRGDNTALTEFYRKLLHDAGFQGIPARGKNFGPKTQAATKLLQEAVGMNPTGVFDSTLMQKIATVAQELSVNPQKASTLDPKLISFIKALKGQKNREVTEVVFPDLFKADKPVALPHIQAPPLDKNRPVLNSPIAIQALRNPTLDSASKSVAKRETELIKRTNPKSANHFGIDEGATSNAGKLIRNLLQTHGHTKQLTTHVSWQYALENNDFSGIPKDMLKNAIKSLESFIKRDDLSPRLAEAYVEHSNMSAEQVRSIAEKALVAIRRAGNSPNLQEP